MPTKYKVHLHPIPYEYKPNSVQVASLSKTITPGTHGCPWVDEWRT